MKLIYTAPLEYLFTQIKLAVFRGVVLLVSGGGDPDLQFVAPGLYKNERDAFLPYLVATPVLFVLGAAVVYFLAMPLVMKFSIGQQQLIPGQASIELLPKVSEYLSLIMTLIFAFGICFPASRRAHAAGAVGLHRLPSFLREKRRYAIVIVFVIAAVLTPPDVISQLALAIPTLLLYEASIYAVLLTEKKRAAAAAKEASSTT